MMHSRKNINNENVVSVIINLPTQFAVNNAAFCLQEIKSFQRCTLLYFKCNYLYYYRLVYCIINDNVLNIT